MAVARQAARPLTDPDSFWHLRLGHQLRDQGSLATPDWGTQDDRDWVLTQWLPEIVASWVESTFGLPGVMWLFGLSLVAMTLLLYLLIRRQAGLLVAGFVTALALVAMSASLSPRPHMLTYIFLILTLLVWGRVRRTGQVPWVLIPMTWLWAACHGMWFVGPLIGLAICAGMTLDGSLREQRAKFLTIPIASIIVAALTPLGPRLLLAPVAVGNVGAFITEWQPPSFRSYAPLAAALMVAIVVSRWARSGDRVSWVDILQLALAAGWIVLAVRTVTLGAIIAAPLVAGALQAATQRDREAPSRGEGASLLLAAALSLAGLALAVPNTSDRPGNVPERLNSRLEALPDGAVVLNDYGVGGWLRWEHPELDPLIDGLTEAYTLDELRDYAVMTHIADGWNEEVASVDADAALLIADSPLALALEDRLGWTQVDSDDDYVLLSPP